MVWACSVAFSYPLFMVIYGHGEFSASSVAALSELFNIYSFGLIFSAIGNIAVFVYYSQGVIKYPVINSLITLSVLNVSVQYLIVGILGVRGLVLSVTITSFLNLMIDALILRRKYNKKIMEQHDMAVFFMIAIISILCGFIRWTPVMLIIPVLYYMIISRRIYQISFAKFAGIAADIVKRR
jgi:peptidoglycan biosynthesis protein MviN/MurJ (putative lipid II flippase)